MSQPSENSRLFTMEERIEEMFTKLSIKIRNMAIKIDRLE